MSEKLTLENWGEMREDIKSSITKELNDLKLEITSDNDKILSNFKDKERKKENISNLWIAATQLKLKELGYEVGKVDGIYGKNTAAATKAFQIWVLRIPLFWQLKSNESQRQNHA